MTVEDTLREYVNGVVSRCMRLQGPSVDGNEVIRKYYNDCAKSKAVGEIVQRLVRDHLSEVGSLIRYSFIDSLKFKCNLYLDSVLWRIEIFCFFILKSNFDTHVGLTWSLLFI